MHAKSFLWRPAAALVLLVLGIGSGGCAMFSSHEKTIVKDSQLNWLEVGYLPGMGQPPVQLSLMGSGHIRIKRGGSPLVGNDFSQDVANEKWSDVSVDQLNIEPAQMHDIFQALVDRGLLREPDTEFAASVTRGIPTARITGTLDMEHVVRVAAEPELVGFIRELIKLFDENKPAAETRK